ncbi:MAG: DTW domain-containing protein [Bacteriovoracaceae bacterium]|nr:DTW domain-containing protein [Bacteriovoracaceae bacterium]
MKNLEEKILAQLRCGTCFLLPEVCLCSLIPNLNLSTKVSLIIHKLEMNRSSNTGRLALKALPNSAMIIRGLKNDTPDLSQLFDDEYETLLLYPSDDSIELTEDFVKGIKKKIQLIVPDGNWGQARKVHTRHKELANIKRVMIQRKGIDRQYLRKPHAENGMSTLQAIAYALGMIEGEAVQDQLLKLYNEKLTRTLRHYRRGQK